MEDSKLRKFWPQNVFQQYRRNPVERRMTGVGPKLTFETRSQKRQNPPSRPCAASAEIGYYRRRRFNLALHPSEPFGWDHGLFGGLISGAETTGLSHKGIGGSGGRDIYDVSFENGHVEWRTFPTGADGVVLGMMFRGLP